MRLAFRSFWRQQPFCENLAVYIFNMRKQNINFHFHNINSMEVKMFFQSIRKKIKSVSVLVIILFMVFSFSDKNLGQVDNGKCFKVLIFSKTSGYRHGFIPGGIKIIQKLGDRHNFDVKITEYAGAFTDKNLSKYQVVVFLNTTGDVLNETQQAAFEQFIQSGKGFVGVHAATDTEYDWEWYGGLIAGAYFKSHPKIQDAIVNVEDHSHPTTAMLPEKWKCHDEWYNFRNNPREKVRVLASLDETSYEGGDMVDHPIIWCHYYDGGRAWYTGIGHTQETSDDPLYAEHLLEGIKWAAGVSSDD